jgi:dipeptidase
MWGAEMGANDAGVVGGNEAVFTRVPVEATGLTGMDLLRLALERAASAREAAQVVIELLERFPQGGRMGHRREGFRYHSSFLFADAGEGWVLETAGRFWALERVRGARAISNALTIGDPDELHPGALEEARARGWTDPAQPFHFARAFSSRLYGPLTGGPQRLACTAPAAAALRTLPELLALLRLHRAPHPADGFRLTSPCAHGSWIPTRSAGQTTGSQASELSGARARHLFTGTSSPCLSVFKPVEFDLALPPTASAEADQSLFWRHERLHRATLQGWAERSPRVRAHAAALEAAALADRGQALEHWSAHLGALPEWTAELEAAPAGGPAAFRAFWRWQSRGDGLA